MDRSVLDELHRGRAQGFVLFGLATALFWFVLVLWVWHAHVNEQHFVCDGVRDVVAGVRFSSEGEQYIRINWRGGMVLPEGKCVEVTRED